MLARHPGICLTLDLNDRRVDADADGFDAAIRHGPLADACLVAWQPATSRRVLVAAPSYIERHGAPRSLEELAQHRGIFYTNRGAADWRFVHGIEAGQETICIAHADGRHPSAKLRAPTVFDPAYAHLRRVARAIAPAVRL